MTLLILEFHVPDLSGQTISHSLAHYLLSLWPTFLCYVMSFLILGVFWIGHHNQFHFIKHSDRLFLWINITFLMCIAFIPFSTALLGRYWKEHVAIALYGGNMTLSGHVLYSHWQYAVRRGFAGAIDPGVARMAGRRILLGMAAYLIAMVISLFQDEWSLFIYALIPFFYIIPGRIDRYWSSRA
jgi:uncharacterized membrane protein